MIERIEQLIKPLLNDAFVEVRLLEQNENNFEFLVMVEEDDFDAVKGKNEEIINAISRIVDFSDKKIKIKLEVF